MENKKRKSSASAEKESDEKITHKMCISYSFFGFDFCTTAACYIFTNLFRNSGERFFLCCSASVSFFMLSVQYFEEVLNEISGMYEKRERELSLVRLLGKWKANAVICLKCAFEWNKQKISIFFLRLLVEAKLVLPQNWESIRCHSTDVDVALKNPLSGWPIFWCSVCDYKIFEFLFVSTDRDEENRNKLFSSETKFCFLTWCRFCVRRNVYANYKMQSRRISYFPCNSPEFVSRENWMCHIACFVRYWKDSIFFSLKFFFI